MSQEIKELLLARQHMDKSMLHARKALNYVKRLQRLINLKEKQLSPRKNQKINQARTTNEKQIMKSEKPAERPENPLSLEAEKQTSTSNKDFVIVDTANFTEEVLITSDLKEETPINILDEQDVLMEDNVNNSLEIENPRTLLAPQNSPNPESTTNEPTPGPSRPGYYTSNHPKTQPKRRKPLVNEWEISPDDITNRKQTIIDKHAALPKGLKLTRWRRNTGKTIKDYAQDPAILAKLEQPPIAWKDHGPCKNWNPDQECYMITQGWLNCKYLHCCLECFFIFKEEADHKFGMECPVVKLLERATR